MRPNVLSTPALPIRVSKRMRTSTARSTTSTSLAATRPRMTNRMPTATLGSAVTTDLPSPAKASRSFFSMPAILSNAVRIELLNQDQPKLPQNHERYARGERGQLGHRGAALNGAPDANQQSSRCVVLKGRQLRDRLAHIYLFPTLPLAQRFIAHRATLSAPVACTCLYRSLNSSRPRLMRIFAAERPTPRAWATSS